MNFFLPIQSNRIESLTEKKKISIQNHSLLFNLVPSRLFINSSLWIMIVCILSVLFIRFNISSSICWTPASDLNFTCSFGIFFSILIQNSSQFTQHFSLNKNIFGFDLLVFLFSLVSIVKPSEKKQSNCTHVLHFQLFGCFHFSF